MNKTRGFSLTEVIISLGITISISFALITQRTQLLHLYRQLVLDSQTSMERDNDAERRQAGP